MPDSDAPVQRRRGRSPLGFGAVVAGLAVVVAGSHLLTLPDGVGWYGDSYQYLLHAENVVAGRPYADTGYIHNPERYMAPVAYPAGFPLILAPVIALFGMNVQAIAVLMTLVWVGTVAALVYLFRHELAPRYVYGLGVVIGLQPYLWALKHDPLSDLPFLLWAVLSLLWYERSGSERSGRSERLGRWALFAVAAGVAAAFSTASRPLGLLLLPAFLIADLVRARRPSSAFVVAAVSAGVVYGAYVGLVDLEAGGRVVQAGGGPAAGGLGGEGGYGALVRIALLDHLTDLPQNVVDRLVDYARATFVFWHVPVRGGAVLKNVLMGLSLIPVGIGIGYRLRRRFGVIEAFCLLYALSLLPWSFSGVRYLAPLVPFYYFYLFAGLERLHAARERAGRAATVAVSAALLIVFGLQYRSALFEGPDHPGLDELAADPVYAYLREETPRSAVVITSGDPRPPVFFSRRAAAAAPQDVRRWPAFAEHVGASYALVGGGEKEEVGRQLSPSHFQLVSSSQGHDLYRIAAPRAEE
jgi:4-amino-4-deoxy-L-arabinose transferase-like glycosyltransferase